MASIGLNAAFLTSLRGERLDPYQGFNFLVEIEGILAGAFSECSGLTVETEFLDYREGGVNEYVHRLAGPTKYPPLVLKHGLTQSDGLYLWHQDVVRRKVERKNGTIYLLDKNHVPVALWNFKEAFPYKWTGPDLKAESASVVFEAVELAHRGLEHPPISELASDEASLGAFFGL